VFRTRVRPRQSTAHLPVWTDTQGVAKSRIVLTDGLRTARRPSPACGRAWSDLSDPDSPGFFRSRLLRQAAASRQLGQPGLPGGRCSLRASRRFADDGDSDGFPFGAGSRAYKPGMPVSLPRSLRRDALRSADNAHLISVPPRDSQSRRPRSSGCLEAERQRTWASAQAPSPRVYPSGEGPSGPSATWFVAAM